MEDRITIGVYLEMFDGGLEPYLADRLPVVTDRSDVIRASWWENCRPGRDDFPRHVEERTHLAVYEVGDEFDPGPTPDAVSGLHFRHCPRPGQGRLTGRPTTGILLIFISPRRPEQAQALRDWGDFVHLRHIAEAAVPGYTMVTAYERVDEGEPRFMHLYEMDSDDPEGTFQSMTPLVAERLGPPGTPAFDRWALTPELRIDYVNTFWKVGEATAP